MRLGNAYFCEGDIARAITEAQTIGASAVSRMLQESFRAALLEEISALPFKRANERVGVVHQAFDYCAFLGCVPGRRHLEMLRSASEEIVREAGILLSDRHLTAWRAQDVAINRYHTGGGLGAHRDFTWHPTVILIWNVLGSCTFEILDGREGNVVWPYRPIPGDLILLRGAGSADEAGDHRPFHRVIGIADGATRISVTMRQNTNPKKIVPGFLYHHVPQGGA